MAKYWRFGIPVLLAIVVFCLYVQTLPYGFVSDDISGIVQTAHTWKFPSVAVTPTVIHGQMLVWFVIYKLFGLAPWAFRLTNIFCHAVSVVLVFAIVFRLTSCVHSGIPFPELKMPQFREWNPKRTAFFSALLFAAHPIVIESVTWISGGIYCMYGMLFLLSFWLFIRNTQCVIPGLPRPSKPIGEVGTRDLKDAGSGSGMTTQKYMQGSQKMDMFLYFLSFVAYVLCLLFSEKASVLFLLFIVYEWAYGSIKKNWIKLIPYCLVSIISLSLYALQVSGRVSGVVETIGGGKGMYNPFLQWPIVITTYLKVILWPQVLAFYYGEVVSIPEYIVRLILFLGFLGVFGWLIWKKRRLSFWIFWFIIPLLPVLTPLKIAWLVAERYAYLSVIGIFVIIAYGFELVIALSRVPSRVFPLPTSSSRKPSGVYERIIDHIKIIFGYNLWHCGTMRDCERSKGIPIREPPVHHILPSRAHQMFFITCSSLIALIIFALIVRTYIRNRDWQNEDTLWIATAQTSPLVPYTWNNMGDVYSRHGDLNKAAESFQRAIMLNPNYADAHHNLGEAYRQMGEIGDAKLMFEQALQLNPKLWQSYASLANIALQKKDYQQALVYVEKALQIVPDSQMLLTAREQLRGLED